MFFVLREDGGPLKDKGKWKCVLTNKLMFLNEDLGRQLAGDKVSSHKLLLEGHISVLSFSDYFCSQAMLSCTVLSSWNPTVWSYRTASRKGAKLTVPTPQIILRLPKH